MLYAEQRVWKGRFNVLNNSKNRCQIKRSDEMRKARGGTSESTIDWREEDQWKRVTGARVRFKLRMYTQAGLEHDFIGRTANRADVRLSNRTRRPISNVGRASKCRIFALETPGVVGTKSTLKRWTKFRRDWFKQSDLQSFGKFGRESFGHWFTCVQVVRNSHAPNINQTRKLKNIDVFVKFDYECADALRGAFVCFGDHFWRFTGFSGFHRHAIVDSASVNERGLQLTENWLQIALFVPFEIAPKMQTHKRKASKMRLRVWPDEWMGGCLFAEMT